MSDGDVIFRVLLKGELLRVEVTEVVKVFTKNGTVEAYNLDGTFLNIEAHNGQPQKNTDKQKRKKQYLSRKNNEEKEKDNDSNCVNFASRRERKRSKG